MVAEKTYCALQSRAQAGPAQRGGSHTATGRARRTWCDGIFQMYADGFSAKHIAEALNREGVPSPGSFVERTNAPVVGVGHPAAISGDATEA